MSAVHPGPVSWPQRLARAPGWLALGGVVLSGVLSVLLALAPALLPAPASGSPEGRFVQEMLVHHAQAVDMARRIAPRTQDPALKTLAVRIRDTQAQEITQLRALLQAWGQPTLGTLPAHHAAQMGMASVQAVAQLSHLPVPEAERLFLQLMIRHHQGAVQMARPFQGWLQRPDIRGLARHVSSTQRGETGQLQTLLTRRGGQPLPPPPSPHH